MSILEQLGIDPDTFEWQDLAACAGMDTELFYDKYEKDAVIAESVDETCLGCPVIAACFKTGIGNNEHGVWGGVYLSNGRVDKNRNQHKTPETWKKIERLTGK